MRILRLAKGCVWCCVFTALCAWTTLAAMRLIAARGGNPRLYECWREEMRDAFAEAGEFLGDCWEGAEKAMGGAHRTGTGGTNGGGR